MTVHRNVVINRPSPNRLIHGIIGHFALTLTSFLLDVVMYPMNLDNTHAAPSSVEPSGWVAPNYNHIQLVEELRRRIHVPLGTVLDEHQLYLDSASAVDWITYCSRGDYTKGIGFDRNTLEWSAKVIHRYLKESHFEKDVMDVVALGPGDGKNESTLCNFLAENSELRRLNCYLLDINPSLAVEAYKNLTRTLQNYPSVKTVWMLGDFMNLNEYGSFFGSAQKQNVLRLVCMFGGTFGNLESELRFVRHSLSRLKKGDLFLVHISLGCAPANHIDVIKNEEPFFQHIREQKVPAIEAWVRGPIDRYHGNIKNLTFDYSLMRKSSSNFKESYTLAMSAIVNESSCFTMLEMHRYNLEDFIGTMSDEGFKAIGGQTYGYKNKRLVFLFSKA